MDERIARGKWLAESGHVRPVSAHRWRVQSQTRSRAYFVNTKTGACTCPDYEDWQLPCKHVYAVRIYESLRRSQKFESLDVMPRTYQQNWAAYDAAQTHEKEQFERLLSVICSTVEDWPQERGRPRFHLADVIFFLTMKVYTTLSGRRAVTDLRASEVRGLLSAAPHHNTISRYMRMPELTPVLIRLIERSALPLRGIEQTFAVDSTGFGTRVYDHWSEEADKLKKTKKSRKRKAYPKRNRRKWIKCHAMVGVKTNIVTAVKITKSHGEGTGDAPQLRELLATTARSFRVKEVCADGAYLSVINVMSIADTGGIPFIPFKDNVSANTSTSKAWQESFAMFTSEPDEFKKRYHQRSNVETVFAMLKRKIRPSVRSKKDESQMNEVLCMILAHNLIVLVHEMYERGIHPTFSVPDDGRALN